jgi:cardiolipin synthase
MAALRLAAMRGVDVRIIVPDKSDNPLVDLAARWYAKELAGEGLRFFRYTDGFPHQKVLLVDNDVSSVGSANFDNRSFSLQFEINALIVDETLAKQVETMLLNDLAHSVPWDPAALIDAPLLERLKVSASRLTAPLL